MFKKCNHEYVDTGKYLPEAIGPCCKKCGKPLVKHEHFSYWWRTKKAFSILITAWRRFNEIDYNTALEAVTVLIAFVILLIAYLIAPFLAVSSPLIGFVGWVRVNRKLRRRVKEFFNNG